MLETKKAPAAWARGTGKEAAGGRKPCKDYSTPQDFRQVCIADLLHHGAANGTTARELAALLGWRPREITRQVERERRAGTPICAGQGGYYLPASAGELDGYLRQLQHREAEISKTRTAVAATRQLRMTIKDGEQRA